MPSIIKKVLAFLFDKPKIKHKAQTKQGLSKEEYIGAISFKLTKNNDIDVMYSLPDISNKSSEELLDVADKYGKFLMVINQGYLQQDIIDILRSNVKPDDDSKDHLLLDNILLFWSMSEIEAETRLNSRIKKQQPLIRPSTVFNRNND
jgi:hypothetical protein